MLPMRLDQFGSGFGGSGDVGMSGFGESINSDKQELSEKEKVEFRQVSLEHHLACGVTFVGLMAAMCGEDAGKLTNVDWNENSASARVAVAASRPATASTSANYHSKTMATLRQRVASLQPPTIDTVREEFNNLKEMMDEIQEAMDSAEETEEGLKILGEIKKHEMKQNGEEDENLGVEEKLERGIITTIGFGAPSSSAVNTVNAFGISTTAAAAATTMTAAHTMMVVKKKRKKPQADDSANGSGENDVSNKRRY